VSTDSIGSSDEIAIAAAAGRGVARTATRRRVVLHFDEVAETDVGTRNRLLIAAVSRARGARTRALTAGGALTRAIAADIIVT
jgi:hypothetical protein|tara:strand:- start:9686 stop:9934 length:249 start_codon:yes stop_codon:yes gene_type:complete